MHKQKESPEPYEENAEERERNRRRKELRGELERGNPDGLVFLEDSMPVSRRKRSIDVKTKIPVGDKRYANDKRNDILILCRV